MEALAKFDFNASGEEELSFQAGDVLKVNANQVPTKGSSVYQCSILLQSPDIVFANHSTNQKT